ncbi:MAG: hypothetical protein QME28_07555 [Candidatus Saccharicenans sp.]|nr:hypothetical protein [Candidatus Saccharicenans sp.]
MSFKKSKPCLLVPVLIYLFLILTDNAWLSATQISPVIWQMRLKLKIEGNIAVPFYRETDGTYLLEIDWVGFIEEDGLDFVIYHLGSCSSRSEFCPSVPGSQAVPVAPPEMKLDYVEGQVEQINFFYSLHPETVVCTAAFNRPVKFRLPSLPWSRLKGKDLQPRRRLLKGVRGLTLPRSFLNKDTIRQEFSWEELIEQEAKEAEILPQIYRVKISLELERCRLRPELQARGWKRS